MPTAVELPANRACTVDEFIAFTGWEVEAPTLSRRWMAIALGFYQDVIPHDYLRARAASPSPWGLPRGNVLRLCELMQAIDFTQPVWRTRLHPGQQFKRFCSAGEPQDRNPRGNWFALLPAVQKQLALPAGQVHARIYVVRAGVEALQSKVSDAFTWLHPTGEDPLTDRYFHGSGEQFFVWDSFHTFVRDDLPAVQRKA